MPSVSDTTANTITMDGWTTVETLAITLPDQATVFMTGWATANIGALYQIVVDGAPALPPSSNVSSWSEVLAAGDHTIELQAQIPSWVPPGGPTTGTTTAQSLTAIALLEGM